MGTIMGTTMDHRAPGTLFWPICHVEGVQVGFGAGATRYFGYFVVLIYGSQ